MPLKGVLDLYPLPAPGKGLPSTDAFRPYFTAGDLDADRALLFIGGLTNGLLDPRYTQALSPVLEQAGWRLVLIHWSSAYDGYGTGSLDRDVSEMSALIKHIRENDGVKKVVIMGHSTGSQDVIHYLTSTGEREPVDGGIMQAPASDRQYFLRHNTELWSKYLKIAQQLMKEGKKDQVLADEFNADAGCRMTAYRLHSLVGIGGDDDYFSTDLPENDDEPTPHVHPLNKSFGQLKEPALALWSEKDEYGDEKVDMRSILDAWVKAGNGKLTAKVVEGASHNCQGEEPTARMCKEVIEWLKQFD